MKSIIITTSVHHGNTRKVVEAIASRYDVEVVDATKTEKMDLSEYDLIGFASGIYGFNFHQSITKFAENSLPTNKKIFLISTSATNKDFSSSFLNAIADKNPEILGKFSCTGYNTFGPFKLVGGTGKGHPDETDLNNAVLFYESLIK